MDVTTAIHISNVMSIDGADSIANDEAHCSLAKVEGEDDGLASVEGDMASL